MIFSSPCTPRLPCRNRPTRRPICAWSRGPNVLCPTSGGSFACVQWPHFRHRSRCNKYSMMISRTGGMSITTPFGVRVVPHQRRPTALARRRLDVLETGHVFLRPAAGNAPHVPSGRRACGHSASWASEAAPWARRWTGGWRRSASWQPAASEARPAAASGSRPTSPARRHARSRPRWPCEARRSPPAGSGSLAPGPRIGPAALSRS